MKKRVIKISLILCIAVGFVIGYIFYHFMWDTQSVKKGEFLRAIESPQGNYVANIYHGTGGATVDFSTIVEIEKRDSKEKKIIYFQYHCEDVKVKWLSEKCIEIENKKMNILKDVYDYRHE